MLSRKCSTACDSACFVIMTVLILLFSAYILLKFLLVDPLSWETVSRYYLTRYGMIFIGIHFYSGFLIQTLLPLQLLPALRTCSPIMHRYLGRTLVVLSCSACICGSAYVVSVGTVGGLSMNISFLLYACTFGSCAILTIYYARKKQFKLHRDWAIRLSSQILASGVYRLYISPLFLHSISHSIGFELDEQGILLWLNVAAWLFFLPNLAVAEILIRHWRGQEVLESQASSTSCLPRTGDETSVLLDSAL